MRLIRHVLGWILGVAAVLLVVVAGAAYLWLRSSLPTTKGTVTVAGLAAPAEITRDRHGLVYIRADSADDAYFALGYAHAQDRLWQMEAMRRLGAGRLAEIAGARFVPQDRLMRTLGLYRLAQESLPLLSVGVRNALDAYARGVNAWIAGHKGSLPPEFALLGITPEPWRPADSLVWGRLMAFSLSGNWRQELLRARLDARLGTNRAAQLFPPYPADAPVTLPSGGHAHADVAPLPGAAAAPAGIARRVLDALARALPAPPPSHGASNTWVIGGTRTGTGKPVLANDPHLGFRAPNIWYLVRMTAPGLSVAGATTPGVPFVVLGHNDHIAWGMTTTGADTEDLVVEKLAPGAPDRYLAPDGPRAFVTRREIIHVRGGPDVPITVRETRDGPVLSGISHVLATQAGPGAVIALRATGLIPDDRTAEALYRINRARDWTSFTAALALFDSPVQNLSYADTAGHIGFSVAGRIPIRRKGDGETPVPGADAAYDWTGFIPPAALPRALDPKDGLIVNANNKVVGTGYPYFIARDWEEPYRAERIEEVLSGPGPHGVAASRKLQLDALSLAARQLLPVLLRMTPRTAATTPLLDRLAHWNDVADRNRPEPLLFTAWLMRIMHGLFADELGPLMDRFDRLKPRLVQRVITRDTAWCDNVTTGPRETCPQILETALLQAHDALARRFGTDVAHWRWGDVHVATFRDAALDWIPLLGALTRITIATDGDDFTVNRGTSRLGHTRNPYAHVHGATFRGIYDLADLDRSLFAMPGGESGNPFSPHYRDLTRGWRDGDYVTLPAKPEEPHDVLRLVPPRGPLPRPTS